MADVDTSIYKNQPNPLATLSGIYGVVNAAQYNQLLQANTGLTQLQLQGQQGVANAYRNNVNPDGTVNSPGLISALGADAGPLAGPAIGQAIGNQQQNFALQKGYTDYVVGTLGAFSSDPNPTAAKLTGTVAQVAKNAGVPPAVYQPFITDIQNNPQSNNPDYLRSRAADFQRIVLGGQGANPTPAAPGPGGVPQVQPIGSTAGTLARPVGLTPAGVAAQTAAGGVSGTAQGNVLQAASDYQSRVTPLTKIVHLLDMVGPRGQGIGTETTNTIKNLAEGAGIVPPGTTAPVEQLKKYYVQNALRNADIGSTDKMVAAFHGNPNLDLNQQSAAVLARTDLSLLRMKQAQALELSGVAPEQFQQRAAAFNNQQDPVAYGFDLMSGNDQRAYLNSIKNNPDAYNRFTTSMAIAHRHQLLERPNAGQ